MIHGFLIGLLGASLAAAVGATEAAPWAGRFEGTGRACSGTLSITSTSMAWRTRYSNCSARRYTVYEGTQADGPPRLVAQLTRAPDAGCPYAVVEVEKATDYGWNVTGFRSLATYRTAMRATAGSESRDAPTYLLSCLMTKVR